MTPHADAADALAALVLCHDRLDQIDALPQLYVAAGRDLPGSLPGRLVTGAKQINPFLNASVQTYDVGVILLHLLVPQQRPKATAKRRCRLSGELLEKQVQLPRRR